MADESNPVTTSGTTSFGQSGSGTPANPAATNSTLNSALSDMSQATGAVEDQSRQLLDTMKGLNEPAKVIAAALQDWQTKLKGIVTYTEDYEEAFKRLIILSRSYGESGIFKARNYRELKAHLESLIETQKEMMKEGFFSRQEQAGLQKMIEHTSKGVDRLNSHLKETGRTLDDSVDPDVMAKLASNTRAASMQVEKMTRHINSMHIKPITKNLMQLNEAMGRSGNLEKYAKYAQVAERISKMKATQNSEDKVAMRQNMELMRASTIHKAKQAGLMGAARHPSLRSVKPAYFKDIARELSEKGNGGGFLDRYLGQRALKKIADGDTGSFMARSLQAGQGSVMKGMGQVAFQNGASGIEGVAGGIARYAPILAIGDLLEKFIDANAKMNADVADKLGEAGIFSAGGNGTQNLFNVRKSLMSQNYGFNLTGETFQKNLKIAQAIKEGGVNLPELASGVRPGETSGVGKIKGVAYGGAKLAGFMDEAAATQQIMKLLQQYKTSFEGTEDFFAHINKDTARAGITTTKYIGIIDEINKQFDRMGQSLENTVNVMRVLGRTGVESTDDVREALETLTNAGKSRSFEMQAFLGMQNAQQGRAPENLKLEEANVNVAAKRAREALSAPSLGLKIGNVNSMADVGVLKQQLMRSTAGSPVERQTALGTLNQLEQAIARRDAAKRVNELAKQGRFGEAGLAQASANASLGYNMTGKTMETFQGVRSSLQAAGVSMNDFLSGKVDISTNPALAKIGELIGNDPQIMMKLRRVVQAQAGSTMQLAGRGQLQNDSTYSRLARIAETIPTARKDLKGQTDRQKIMNLLKVQPEMSDKIGEKLSEQGGMLQDIVDSEAGINEASQDLVSQQDKQEQAAKAEDIATATRPMADIFADAFDNLFQTISAPLSAIYTWLTQHFGGAAKAGEGERVRQEYGTDAVSQLITHLDTLKEESVKNLRNIQQTIDEQPDLEKTDPKRFNELKTQEAQAKTRTLQITNTLGELIQTQQSATSNQGITQEASVMQADAILKNAPVFATQIDKQMAKITQDQSAQNKLDAGKTADLKQDQKTADQAPNNNTTIITTTNIGANVSAHPIPPAATNQAPGEGTPAITTLSGKTVQQGGK